MKRLKSLFVVSLIASSIAVCFADDVSVPYVQPSEPSSPSITSSPSDAAPSVSASMPSAPSASSVPMATDSPCSLPANTTIPEYNAKIASLRAGADQNLIAYTAMTSTARKTADGQGMIQQARDMFSEAQACQKMADDLALQISTTVQ